MKKILLLASIILYSSCSNTTPNHPLMVSNTRGEGGNPEARVHICLEKKSSEAKKNCLNMVYPDNSAIKIYIAQAPLKLYSQGRDGTDDTKRVFDLSEKKYRRFIIHIDTGEVKGKISCSVKEAKVYQKDNKVTIDIPVENIKNRVILYNSQNNIIREFLIKK